MIPDSIALIIIFTTVLLSPWILKKAAQRDIRRDLTIGNN